ncbi:MAG: FKBP-type peptidyl-prolyl cis-trans isomerase [Acidobacteria bacterium]|jgi:FKBP-type peptidyl-prolyl cis-trans isomerase|nr:FKBP-type peptidyl-prolyl cis-trans isomerase [Acidobacteriota bacterium]MCU0253015.1 FKBP-type peptidyl-prolyl cis-trans isomerase [Acidobacteriota bacterium]
MRLPIVTLAAALATLPTALAAGTPPSAAPPAPPAATAPTPGGLTEDQKVVYALGLAMGQRLGDFSLTPQELEFLQKGVSDSVLGRPPQVDLQVYGPKIMELAQARQQVVIEKSKKEGTAYLEQAAQLPGAKKTASGLVYIEEKAGTGASPKPADKIKIHYHGTTTDGTVFDSSVDRGTPAEFELGSLIPCWVEGIQLMKVGGKAKLVCPPSLAYGDRGAPPVIKPGATLTFQVELIDILAAAPETPPAAPPAGTP